jgi:hypothetical protein
MTQWKGIIGCGFKSNEFDNYVRSLSFGLWRPQFVVLHHTSQLSLAEWHAMPGEKRMEEFVYYYRTVQKLVAGPHLFIADDLIWVFTPLTTTGRHSPSWNHKSWGVEIVGDYGQETLNQQVRNNTVAALVSLYGALGQSPSSLYLHRDDPLSSQKDCPGHNVNKIDIIHRVTKQLLKKYKGEHLPYFPNEDKS